jgi:predicted ATPase/DNA-binding winged helix-turn-helix (wHTH) protein/tetratricopeptide (TPR) repeat protein
MDRTRSQKSSVVAARHTAYRFDGFELRPGRQLLRDGNPIPIGSTALELLCLLVKARGDLVSKDELFEAVWSGVVVVENTLHQHIRALRKALGDQDELIITVARRGYRFTGAVQEVTLDSWEASDELGRPPALPAPLTALIGREDELVTIELLLQSHRCVTLLGPGGVGKTRLALEIAQRRLDGRKEDVFLAELAAITDGDDIAGAIATAVGLSGPSGTPLLARIRHALRDTAALLVVDNCEHLIDATAAVARDLLQSCPSLQVVATSQRPLCISGEQRLQVPALGLPPPATSAPSLLAASPAVRLLLARVGDCGSRLAFDGDALKDAAELCRQLDGNALAIELAAVRVAALGLAATCAGLADRLQLLAGGRRDVLPKHQTLNSLIDWSHDLLTAEQQATFRRLSVFSGGWTVESAREIVGDAVEDRTDMGSRLAELVEWSLIARETSTRSPRFRMLETQRIYAKGKLRASGEEARHATAHAQYMCKVFEASYADWDTTPDDQWIARYGPERDNLRAAIRTATESHDPALAARLIGSSIWLWRVAGATQEFHQVLADPILRSVSTSSNVPAARTLLASAYALHATSTDSQRIKAAAELAMGAFEGMDDTLGAANAALCLASAFAQLGDTASHKACLAHVEAVLGAQRNGKTFGWFCGSHAWAAQLAGDPREALEWAIRSRAAYRDSGGWHGETRAMLHIADLKLAVGDLEGAIVVGNESVQRLKGGLHRDDFGRALANLGAAWFARGELVLARDCWSRALAELRGLDFTYWVFDHIALLAIAEGRDRCAAQLIGYADAGYARLQKGRRVQNEQRSHTRAMAYLESKYGNDDLATTMFEGANASEVDVIAMAMAL